MTLHFSSSILKTNADGKDVLSSTLEPGERLASGGLTYEELQGFEARKVEVEATGEDGQSRTPADPEEKTEASAETPAEPEEKTEASEEGVSVNEDQRVVSEDDDSEIVTGNSDQSI